MGGTTSQPFAAMPSQSWKSPSQTNPHVEPAHVGDALGGSAHAFPHEPQCMRLVRVSAHVPEQCVSPDGQLERHEPSLHTSPVSHALPQPPQSMGVVRSTSQPSSGIVLQSSHPVTHVCVHDPSAQ